MKKLFNNIILILFPLILSSCDSQKNYEAAEDTQALSAPAQHRQLGDRTSMKEFNHSAPDRGNTSNEQLASGVDKNLLPAPPAQVQPQPNYIIKTADIRFKVEDYKKSHKNIQQKIKASNAVLSNERENKQNNQIQNHMVIRVSPQNFDKLINDLIDEAIYVNNKSISAEDITAEYRDIEARLNSRRKVEQRYLELLQKAKTVEDILRIEQQLQQIREHIEAAEARIKHLKDQVVYSTIRLSFYEELDYISEPESGFFKKIWEAFRKGWEVILDFIIMLVHLWAFILLALIAIFLFRRYRRGKVKK